MFDHLEDDWYPRFQAKRLSRQISNTDKLHYCLIEESGSRATTTRFGTENDQLTWQRKTNRLNGRNFILTRVHKNMCNVRRFMLDTQVHLSELTQRPFSKVLVS